MTIEKTHALILSVMPYRESSSIAALLSRSHGRVSGIAKGVRRSSKAPLVLERGLVVELFLYVKPHRDLHTIADPSVIDYFPAIRADLGRLVLRDAALELILRSTAASETHPELFDFAVEFLDRLEKLPNGPSHSGALWGFFYGWARLLGFRLDLDHCLRCRGCGVTQQGGLLAIEKGGLVCTNCAPAAAAAPSFLPGEVIALLLEGERADHARLRGPMLSPLEQMRITRLLADYCRYHLDIRGELKSLGFLEGLMKSGE
jgi:DNA repair protein RecO (recombination protein O)